ncbi:HET-domain-containing protein, partial [Polyplosphaeria fusca]
MRTYIYQQLDVEHNEIRLFRLKPGEFEDDIHIEIFHTPLVSPEPVPSIRFDHQELKDTLPLGHEVYETSEGVYMFRDQETGNTSWTHPNSTIDESLYAFAEMPFPYAGFEPRYETLSYTWDTEYATESIFVDDPGTPSETIRSTVLLVRPNLFSALKHMRYSAGSRLLWIDAICIDQDNTLERNHEVKRMCEIYRCAFRVVVWLGDASTDSWRALQLLRYAGEQVETADTTNFLVSPEARELKWTYPSFALPYTVDDGQAIRRLLERPWWDRLWIWQEIHVANTRALVQCGKQHETISWSLLARALTLLQWKTILPPALPRSLLTSRYLLCKGFETSDPDFALFSTQNARYSVDQDRIYAILGLLDVDLARRLEIDYSRPATRVFQDFCTACLGYYDDLGFLQFCDMSLENIEGKPSWVPDWSQPFTFGGLLYGSASGSGPQAQIDTVENGVLKVMGIICGKVQHVSPHSNQSLWQKILSWQPNGLEDEGNLYYTRESMMDAFLRVICRNFCAARVPGWDYPSIDIYRKVYLFHSKQKNREFTDVQHARVEEQLSRTTKGRTFFQTERHIGLCPLGTEPDDLLCVLLGCEAPIILRVSDEDMYQVVGPAYAHDLMDAEALLGPLPNEWRIHYVIDANKGMTQLFTDLETNSTVDEDPRLGPLPEDWEYDQGGGYRNRKTDKPTWLDPRLSPEHLRARGVNLQTFRL